MIAKNIPCRARVSKETNKQKHILCFERTKRADQYLNHISSDDIHSSTASDYF